ncbi:MAG: alkaline phosphatase family protein [Deltaproteobacteria bacterium]|nr:alkaline phosphatase family protein [Deltaproteobacteria bacterium]
MMRFRFWLAGVLAAAAAVRVALLFQTLGRPGLRDLLLLDSRVYDRMATQITAGDLLAGDEAFSLGPLYAYFVSLIRWLGPDGTGVVFAVQQLLGLATVAMVALIARRCCGPRAGIAAALLIGFYGAVGMLEVKLMGSTLATFLGVASLALLLFAHDRRWTIGAALAGLLLGWACLTRPNTLLFVPLAIGWWVWAQREHTPRDAGARRVRVSLAGAAALGCGVVVAIAPATLRNHWVTGEFMLISSQAGITFFHGNNREAYGLFSSAGRIKGNPLTQASEQRRVAEQAAGRPLSGAEVSRYWFGLGLADLRTEPARAVGLIARKLRFWLSSDEVPVDYSLAAERELTPALWLAPVPFGLILAFAFLGLRSASWREPPRVLLYLFVLANLLSILVFYFASRYRVPAVPILAVLAGCGAMGTVERLRRPGRELIAWLLPALVIAGLSLYSWTDDLHQSALAQFFNYGNIHTRQKEPALAIESYRRALPGLDHVAQLHINLAVAYRELDAHGDAIRHLERALEIQPDAPNVRLALEAERAKSLHADPSTGPLALPSTAALTRPAAPADLPLGHRHVEALLVVALDGATWLWMTPLIDQGRLPVMEGLLRRGVWASLETLEPTVSPAIWTTIATGTLPERHGILGFDGVPGQSMETLPNAGMRRVKAWWEMLDAAGLTSGTIGWWASWPADPLRPGSYLVSDRVPYTRMEAAVRRATLDARDTQPAGLIAEVGDLVERPNDIDRDEARRFLQLTDEGIDRLLLPAKYEMGRYLPEFKFVYQSDRSTWKIAHKLIAQHPVDLAAVYFAGIDTVSHLYWHFSFPESLVGHTVARKKVNRFRDVIPLYYELMDRYIGDLLEVAGAGTTVMVVSDHGFGATGTLPWSGGHGHSTRGAPIAPPGVLILSGPGIAGDGAELARARVIDIAPTLLALLGLPVAEDMPGRPLVEAFAGGEDSELSRIPSWEEVGRPRTATVVPVDPRGDAERMERLRALGYIE